MKKVVEAQLNELDNLVKIDIEVIGSDSRRENIKNAIEEERCLIAKVENTIVGFLTFNAHFFDCAFISLIIVSPKERRKGYATSLMEYFVTNSPTKKTFSSTNQSNKKMQEVFLANGFVKSGIVENLDGGDPEIIYYKSK